MGNHHRRRQHMTLNRIMELARDCIANIAGDLTRLGAALRAVLDRHKAVTVSSFRWPESMGVVNRCEACGHPWPCPDYRNVSDALGDTDA
jgi:hypothetical protein